MEAACRRAARCIFPERRGHSAAQRSTVGVEIQPSPANNLIRVHCGQPPDKQEVVQLCIIGFEKQCKPGKDYRVEGTGIAVPGLFQQAEHPEKGVPAQQAVSIDDRARGDDFVFPSASLAQRPTKAGLFHQTADRGGLRVHS